MWIKGNWGTRKSFCGCQLAETKDRGNPEDRENRAGSLQGPPSSHKGASVTVAELLLTWAALGVVA